MQNKEPQSLPAKVVGGSPLAKAKMSTSLEDLLIAHIERGRLEARAVQELVSNQASPLYRIIEKLKRLLGRKRDPNRPIAEALRDAYYERLALLYEDVFAVSFAGFLKSDIRTANSGPELVREIDELRTWIEHGASSAAKRAELQRELLLFCQSLGIPYERLKDLERPVRGKGRPAKTRWLAVMAYEKKLLRPSLSWGRLAIKHCDCGRFHSMECSERIRRTVLDLKRLLSKYKIAAPAQASMEPK